MTPRTIVSHAQNFEDVLLWRALHGVGRGFYIDVGACDPTVGSLSRAFYEAGWRGIHLEPSAECAARLRRHRPDEVVVQALATDSPGVSSQEAALVSITLDQVFGLTDAPEIHWLRISAGGAENKTLKGWRKAAARPWIVVVASVLPDMTEPAQFAWEAPLLKKGYEFAHFDGVSRYYISTARRELKTSFGYGPSCRDDFRLPQGNKWTVGAAADDTLRMSAELRDAREEAGRARDEVEKLRTALATSHDACARFQAAFSESEMRLTQARADLAFAHDELNRARANAEVLTARCDRLEAAAVQNDAELRNARAEADSARNVLDRLRGDCSAMENAALRSSAELEVANARLAVLQSKYDVLQLSAFRSSSDLERANAELQTLRAGFDALQSSGLMDGAQVHPAIAGGGSAADRSAVAAAEAQPEPERETAIRVVTANGAGPQELVFADELARALARVDTGDARPCTAVVGPPDAAFNGEPGRAILVGHDWDEGGYPQPWTERLNERFSGVGCSSQHARKILIDHGADVPVLALGAGTDQWTVPAADAHGRGFRFIHIARNPDLDGTDLAVESFARVFRSSDEVSLVIACTASAAAAVRASVDSVRTADKPGISMRIGECGDAEIASLLAQSHVLVAPVRAAGFSPDIARAIRSGLDVIATRWGGHLDYCSDDAAFLIDFGFETSASDRSLYSSVWARPRMSSLDAALRSAYASSSEARKSRSRAARERLSERFTWRAVAARTVDLARRAESDSTLPRRRVAWVSTWNSKCGIAAACGHLVHTLPQDEVVVFAPLHEKPLRRDPDNCLRLWQLGKEHNGLASILDQLEPWSVGGVVIHFDYGFYAHAELSDFMERVSDRGIAVVIELHSTSDTLPDDPNFRLDTLLPGLRKCWRILAHSPGDMNRLKALGLVDNVVHFPVVVINRGYMPEHRDLAGREPLLASVDLALPDNGRPGLETLDGMAAATPSYSAVCEESLRWCEAHDFARQGRRLVNIVRAFQRDTAERQ